MERLSDLAMIAIHYSKRFEVDGIFEAFVKAHLIDGTRQSRWPAW